MGRSSRFDFKELDVYREAVDFLEWTIKVTATIPWRYRRLIDQMLGAALSSCANIAEAAGRLWKPAEASQHYRYAQGSTHESAAYLDALVAMGTIDDATHRAREDQLARIGSMLTRLIQRQDRRLGRR